MFEAITNAIVKELNHAVDGVVKTVQRRVLRILLKAFFIIAGVSAVMVALILIGSKYLGMDVMLLLAGVVFILAFFLA